MKRYDLLYEGLVVFAIIALLVIVLAAAFSSPEYPTVRSEDVAKRQPLLYLKPVQIFWLETARCKLMGRRIRIIGVMLKVF
jgi:hypothetical protein